MLNEPRLKHVHANESNVVSEPLQGAFFPSRESFRLRGENESGTHWRSFKRHVGAITNTNKHAQENTQSRRKMETPFMDFAKTRTWVRARTPSLLFYMNSALSPSSLPAHRWFGGWDQKDLWLTAWCCFNGRGQAAGIGILSGSLEYWVIKSDLTGRCVRVFVCVCLQ